MIKNKLKQNKFIYNIIFYIYRYMPIQIEFLINYVNRSLNLKNKYKQIKNYKNIHEGERCFIVCTGPSLKIDDLNLIKDEVSFSMNSIVLSYKDTTWRPTYYAIQDRVGYEKLKEDIKKYNMKHLFCGISTRKHSPQIDINHIPFPLNLGDHGKKGINHKTKFSNDCYKVVYDGHSITYSVIQLAIYMGFKEIYLIGLDCNYSNKGNDHVIEYATQENLNAEVLMKNSFKVAKNYADNNGIKIYNATRGGKLEVFERVNIDDLFLNKSI